MSKFRPNIVYFFSKMCACKCFIELNTTGLSLYSIFIDTSYIYGNKFKTSDWDELVNIMCK